MRETNEQFRFLMIVGGCGTSSGCSGGSERLTTALRTPWEVVCTTSGWMVTVVPQNAASRLPVTFWGKGRDPLYVTSPVRVALPWAPSVGGVEAVSVSMTNITPKSFADCYSNRR